MTYHFNITGAERKAMVTKISEILGTPAKYKGMPSAAYQIGEYEVSKDGALSWSEAVDSNPDLMDQSTDLLQQLEAAGFLSEESIQFAECPSELESEPTGLTISVPLENVSVGNLTNLLDSKGALIKKALGIPATPIEITEEAVKFPWFDETPEPAEVEAYSHFICAICKMSKEQKRISATAKEVDNEKYAFRCFLLRLGFIGSEFKAQRKVLLRNLTGSSAFKSGTAKEAPTEADCGPVSADNEGGEHECE